MPNGHAVFATWFEELTGIGIAEESPERVRANLSVDGHILKSHINGKTWVCGELETPSLAELRQRVEASGYETGALTVREVVTKNVQHLHKGEANAGALFQVASQFNLLEMVSPDVTPEKGVGIYEKDNAQGPACAIAAGAGTIYRNYFVPVNGQTGQSATNQIDCLADIGAALGNTENRLWDMRNGYAWPSEDGLVEIGQRLKRLRESSESELDALRQLLRIGLQWQTQVTLNDCTHLVSQAYCSALPVGYLHYPHELWAEFARLILEATYEATLCAALLNAGKTGNNTVFLTLVGGGVFGNETGWILDGLKRALDIYKDAALDVVIVSYRSSNLDIQHLVSRT